MHLEGTILSKKSNTALDIFIKKVFIFLYLTSISSLTYKVKTKIQHSQYTKYIYKITT